MSNTRTTALDISNAFGYLKRDEVEVVKKYVDLTGKRFDPKNLPTDMTRLPPENYELVLVNLGAGTGTSGLAIAEAATFPCRRYTIDISKGGPYGGMQNEINAFSNSGRILPKQILGDALLIGERFGEYERHQIHFLFVDDDHDEDHLRNEIEIWTPRMAAGGFILFHDYDSVFWPGVKRNIDRLAGIQGYRLVEVVNTVAAVEVIDWIDE